MSGQADTVRATRGHGLRRTRYNALVSGSDPVRPPFPGVKLTYDDFVQFPDDGKRHELIDGEHVVTPSPNTKHQTIAAT